MTHHQYVYNDQVNTQRNRRSPSGSIIRNSATNFNITTNEVPLSVTLFNYWQSFNSVFDSTNGRENRELEAEAYIPLVATHTHSK